MFEAKYLVCIYSDFDCARLQIVPAHLYKPYINWNIECI